MCRREKRVVGRALAENSTRWCATARSCPSCGLSQRVRPRASRRGSGIVVRNRKARRGRPDPRPVRDAGRARRDDAFGSAMRALGDDATLRKVAPSSVADVREHSVQLRDGGRLYAPSSRSMRVEEALAQRDRHIVTASCDALGEAASALSRTAPDFHLGSPTSTVLQLYPAAGAAPPSRHLREVVVVCCAGSFALRCAPPSSARELPLSAGDALRVDVERDADALAPLDGAQHGVDFHIDAGDVIYIPAGYYRGLRAKDASTLLIYGFRAVPKKRAGHRPGRHMSPAPHPEDLLGRGRRRRRPCGTVLGLRGGAWCRGVVGSSASPASSEAPNRTSAATRVIGRARRRPCGRSVRGRPPRPRPPTRAVRLRGLGDDAADGLGLCCPLLLRRAAPAVGLLPRCRRRPAPGSPFGRVRARPAIRPPRASAPASSPRP